MMMRDSPRLALQIVQYLLMIGAESAWIYPWTIALEYWIGQKLGPYLAFSTLVAVVAAALVATRLATGLSKSAGGPSRRILGRIPFPTHPLRFAAAYLARVAVVVLGLAVAGRLGLEQLPAFMVGGGWDEVERQYMSSEFGVRASQLFVLAGLLWWRGMKLGRSRPNLGRVEDQFLTGIVAMSALLAVVAIAGQASPLPQDTLMLATLGLLSSTLIGMPLARVVDVDERPRYRGGPRLAPGGCWLTMLLGVVGGLLLATLLLAQLLNFDRIGAIWAAINEPLWAALSAIIYVLALPVGLLVQLLIFLARLLIRPGPQKPQSPSQTDWLDNLQQGEPPALSPELIFVLKAVAIVVLTVALVWLLVRAISRLGDRWQLDGVEESRESVWSWPGLGGLWRWLLARWRPIRARVAALAAGDRSLAPAGDGVRELYRQFLALGAALGRARHPAETPLEYERRLGREVELPGAAEVRALTDGYNRVRYAPPALEPPDSGLFASALARLRAFWQTGK